MVIANSLSKYRAAMNESSMASVAADYSLLKSPVYTIVVPVVVVVVVLVVLVSVLVRLLTRKPQWRQNILAAVCGCCLSKEKREKQPVPNLADKRTGSLCFTGLSVDLLENRIDPPLAVEVSSIERYEQCYSLDDSPDYGEYVEMSGTNSSQKSVLHNGGLENVYCDVQTLSSRELRLCDIVKSSNYSPPKPNVKCSNPKRQIPFSKPRCAHSRPLSLSATKLFHTAQMSSDLQRASSLGDNEAHKLSGTAERYDSGFSSNPSICTLDTVTDCKHQEDPPIGCSHDMITVMKQEFSVMDGRQLGVCYATFVFAIAEVGEEGALLRFQGSSGVRLYIPPGALTVPTTVYLAVRYGDEDTFESYSPTFECGPDGLMFKKIVYLTFPHAAIGSEVMAVMSRQRDKEWKASDGCRTLEMDDNCVTLAIEHFTGFKLTRLDRAAKSRIPVPVGARTGSGKKLALAAFASCDKVRLYISLDDALLAEIINKREMHLGLYPTSPWKPFRFMREQGGLLIQGSCEDCGIPLKCFQYTDDAVLRMEYDYVEFTSHPGHDGIKITVLQPEKPDNCSHMTALFKRSPGNLTSRDIREADEILRVIPLADDLSASLSTLSISSLPPLKDLRGNHSPVEDCDHMGACSCPREHAESGCEMAHCIIRAHLARANRESGYASGRGFSAVISSGEWIEPLKGVVSLENMTI